MAKMLCGFLVYLSTVIFIYCRLFTDSIK